MPVVKSVSSPAPVAANGSADPNASLEDLGFELSEGVIPRRLMIGTQGKERTGKTDFALRTAPEPLVYIGLDPGHEGVIEKYERTRKIYKYIHNIPPVALQEHYLSHWLKVRDMITKAINHQDVRSVILDTGTDIWELLRLAEFGQLNAVGDIKKLYPQINQAYKSLIRMAYDKEINLIVIHKMKKLYQTRTIMTGKGPQQQEYWDGEAMERAGFGDAGYLVQLQVEHIFDPTRKGPLENKFGLLVHDCRQNMDIAGLELWGPECNFRTLATCVFPDSTVEEWL
jgi:hypothetical protein